MCHSLVCNNHFIVICKKTLLTGSKDQQCLVCHQQRPNDTGIRTKYYSEHVGIRGLRTTATSFLANVWIWGSMEVCGTIHEGNWNPVCEFRVLFYDFTLLFTSFFIVQHDGWIIGAFRELLGGHGGNLSLFCGRDPSGTPFTKTLQLELKPK